MGLSGERASYYEQQLQAGRPVVTVHVGGRYQEAKDVLLRCGAFGIDSTGAGTTRSATRSGTWDQGE